MRMATTLRKNDTALCMYCNKNRVSILRWNKPCDSCKASATVSKSTVPQVNVGKPQPAAIVVDEHGNKVFVDKFGNRVDNPGYDLEKDPRGYKFAGLQKEDLKAI